MVNLEPRPGLALSAVMADLCIRINAREIASPKPSPPNSPRDGSFALLEGTEDAGQHFGIDAHAGVGDFHDSSRVRVLPSSSTWLSFQVRKEICPPLGVNLTALLIRFQKTC